MGQPTGTPAPTGPPGDDLDRLVNGAPTHVADCAHCEQEIERLPAGHWRLAARTHAAPLAETRDRIHCSKSRTGYHHPPHDEEGRPIMQRAPAPRAGIPQPEFRTGEPS